MATNLLLGAVLFQSFELPARIRWGGAQRLKVHRLPGGARVIDAMGRDDAQITWSGVFSGPGAGDRARLLDVMRAGGAVWPLSWDSFFYSAVIAEFRADYARVNWIPYRIACTVLRDETAALLNGAASLAADALADLSLAASAGSSVDFSGALAAMAVPEAETVGTAAYGAAVVSVSGAAAQIAAGVSAGEAALAVTSLGDAVGLGQAGAVCGNLAALTNARGYVMRTQANLQNAST
jgi:hypothetical protein